MGFKQVEFRCIDISLIVYLTGPANGLLCN